MSDLKNKRLIKKFKIQVTKDEKIPNFESEDEERKFWSKSDSTDYIDWNKAQKMVLPNLKPSTEMVSLKSPEKIYQEHHSH